MKMLTQTDVRKMLELGVTTLEFKKADNSTRVMEATLKHELLPKQEASKESNRKPNPDVLAVWDVEAKGWRSFRWDRLMTANGKDYEG